MHTARSWARAGVPLVAAFSAMLFVQQPASASFYFGQSFGSGSYHASKDFVPDSSSITIGGYGNSGGAASKWYTRLVRTSDGALISSGKPSWATDGAWHDQSGKSVRSGTALYLRWYGQNSRGSSGYSAPGAGVEAYN